MNIYNIILFNIFVKRVKPHESSRAGSGGKILKTILFTWGNLMEKSKDGYQYDDVDGTTFKF